MFQTKLNQICWLAVVNQILKKSSKSCQRFCLRIRFFSFLSQVILNSAPKTNIFVNEIRDHFSVLKCIARQFCGFCLDLIYTSLLLLIFLKVHFFNQRNQKSFRQHLCATSAQVIFTV